METPWTKDIKSANFILKTLLLFDRILKINTVPSNVSTIERPKISQFAARRTPGISQRWITFSSVSNQCSNNPITDYFTK
jgi:hypothetical protein